MKRNILSVALILIFLVVFNVSVFMIIDEYTSAFWVSIIFIHFAYVIFALSVLLFPKRKGAAVLGFPIIYVSSLYFAIEFLLGVMFIIFKNASFNLAFIPQFVIAGIFGFTIIGNLIVNENIKSSSQKDDEEIFYFKNVFSELKIMQNRVTDPPLKKRLGALSESVKYSQVTSHPAVAGLESAVMVKLKHLKQIISSGDITECYNLIAEIEQILLERNQKIKLFR